MNWKEHPIGIAATVAASTLGVCVTLFFTVILPIWTKELDNTIADQGREISDLRHHIDDKDALMKIKDAQFGALKATTDAQVAKLQQENQKLSESVQSLELSNLFSKDDVYPANYRMIRLGDDVKEVERQYGTAAIKEDNKAWISVSVKDKLFSGVVYYKARCSKENVRIYQILFWSDKTGVDVIADKLKEVYGSNSLKPYVDADDNATYLRGRVINNVYPELDTTASLLLLRMYKDQALCK